MKKLLQMDNQEIIEELRKDRTALILINPADGVKYFISKNPAAYMAEGWKLAGRMTISLRSVCVMDADSNIIQHIDLQTARVRIRDGNRYIMDGNEFATKPLVVGVVTDCGITLAEPVVKLTVRDGIQNKSASRALSMKPKTKKSKSKSRTKRKIRVGTARRILSLNK